MVKPGRSEQKQLCPGGMQLLSRTFSFSSRGDAAEAHRGSELLAKTTHRNGSESSGSIGQTRFFWAVPHGNIVIVKFLSHLGFEVNFEERPGGRCFSSPSRAVTWRWPTT